MVTAPLRIGTRLDQDGARFEVVEISGRRLALRQVGTGAVRQVDLAWLLAHPTTRLADAVAGPVVAAEVLAEIDEAGQAEVARRAGHVREVFDRLPARQIAHLPPGALHVRSNRSTTDRTSCSMLAPG